MFVQRFLGSELLEIMPEATDLSNPMIEVIRMFVMGVTNRGGSFATGLVR